MTPAEAAETLSTRMFLPPATTECLRKVFEGKPELVAALNIDNQSSQARVNEFVAGVRPCLTADVLADSYPKIVNAGVALDQSQMGCVRDTVFSLDEPTRDTLILFGAGTPVEDIAALTPTASIVIQKCNISPIGPPGTGATVGEGGGATMITRAS